MILVLGEFWGWRRSICPFLLLCLPGVNDSVYLGLGCWLVRVCRVFKGNSIEMKEFDVKQFFRSNGCWCRRRRGNPSPRTMTKCFKWEWGVPCAVVSMVWRNAFQRSKLIEAVIVTCAKMQDITQCFDGKLLVRDLSRSTLVFLIMVVMCACGLPCILVSCTEMLDSCWWRAYFHSNGKKHQHLHNLYTCSEEQCPNNTKRRFFYSCWSRSRRMPVVSLEKNVVLYTPERTNYVRCRCLVISAMFLCKTWSVTFSSLSNTRKKLAWQGYGRSGVGISMAYCVKYAGLPGDLFNTRM